MKCIPALLMLVFLVSCRTNESPEAQVNDLEVTTQIKAKLASDIGVSSVTNISVNSTNGVVTLAGQVDSADIKSKAVAIARAVPKVTRVIDNLQVTLKPTSVLRIHGVPIITVVSGTSIAPTSA